MKLTVLDAKRIALDNLQNAATADGAKKLMPALQTIAHGIIANPQKAAAFSTDAMLYLGSPAADDLIKCTPVSVLAAFVQLANLGLSLAPTLGNAWLIPYGNACQLQIGQRGWLTLARRVMGEKYNIAPEVVTRKELADFRANFGAKSVQHVADIQRNIYSDDIALCYAFERMGEVPLALHLLTRDEAENLRKRNKLQKGAPVRAWATDYVAMMKTKLTGKICRAIVSHDPETAYTISADDADLQTYAMPVEYEEVDTQSERELDSTAQGFLTQIAAVQSRQELRALVEKMRDHFGEGQTPDGLRTAATQKIKTLPNE